MNWQIKRLGEVCEVVTGSTPPKADKSNYGDDIPFYKPPHLLDGLVEDTEERLSYKGRNKARIVPSNTVLVSCIGTLGKTALVKFPAAFNQQINAILENESINGKFIFFQAQSPQFKKQLEELATGTTLSIVNKSNFQNILISIPPLPIQQSIVSKIEELLSELDKSVEQLKIAQQQLKTYRQAVLKWAFEGRFTNEVLTSMEFPIGWKRVRLGEVIDKPRYGTSKKCDYDSKNIGVLRIPNISKGQVDPLDLKFAKFSKEEIETYKLNEGDILTIRSNGSVDLVGKSALITSKDEKYLFAGYLIRLRPKKNLIKPKFLLNLLASIELRKQIELKAKSTSGVNNINSEELRNLIIPLPLIKEQDQIISEIEPRLSVADKLEESITTSLQQAESLRQSILKQAFEGKLI